MEVDAPSGSRWRRPCCTKDGDVASSRPQFTAFTSKVAVVTIITVGNLGCCWICRFACQRIRTCRCCQNTPRTISCPMRVCFHLQGAQRCGWLIV